MTGGSASDFDVYKRGPNARIFAVSGTGALNECCCGDGWPAAKGCTANNGDYSDDGGLEGFVTGKGGSHPTRIGTGPNGTGSSCSYIGVAPCQS